MNRQFKVLLVDDDPSTRHLFEAVLDYHDIGLSLAETESQALALLNSDPPDVIVLDIVLPGKDGYKVLKTLKAHDTGCPVIATTAYYTLDSISEFKKRGFDGYLLKPIKPEELVGYLEEVITLHN